MILQQKPTANPSAPAPISSRPLVLITHEFQPFHGGVATFCVELARSLHKLGHPIEVWAPDYGKSCEPDSMGLNISRLPCPGNLRPAGLFGLAREVWRRRNRLEGSILFLPSVGAQMVVILLSLIPGWPRIPTAVLWHGSEILRFQRNPFWKMLAIPFFRKADFLLAASPYVKNLAEECFRTSLNRKVEMIPCAPGSDAYLPPDPVFPDPEGRIRILTLARLHPRKGQLHCIAALAALNSALKRKILYQIAGEGTPDYLETLRQACDRSGIAFEYLGPVPPSRLSSVYAQCNIYAMTSRSLPQSVEGFGITYLEAGLQSKPVIACRSGGVEGAVLDGQTGLLVGENDLPALTAAFTSLISDPSLRQSLGEGNLQHASSFSWDHSAWLLLRHFSQVASEASDKKG